MASKTKTTLLATLAAGPVGAMWVHGQAHWKANDWNTKYQKPWGDKAIGLINRLNTARAAGTLTYQDVQAAQNEFDMNVLDLEAQQNAFELSGGDQAKVIAQSRTKLNPIIESWRNTITQHIEALKPAEPAKPDENAPTMDTLLAGLGQTPTGQAELAAEQARKRARAGGRQSTFLTGPLGLKTAAPVQYKTLLGY